MFYNALLEPESTVGKLGQLPRLRELVISECKYADASILSNIFRNYHHPLQEVTLDRLQPIGSIYRKSPVASLTFNRHLSVMQLHPQTCITKLSLLGCSWLHPESTTLSVRDCNFDLRF